MKLFRPIAAFAAAAALTGAQSAAAATTPCLTEGDVTAVAAFAMPLVLDGTMQKCRPHLAADGYFATQGQSLVARYAANKDGTWPAAKQAFLKFAAEGGDDAMKSVANLPDAALQPFVEAMVTEMFSTKVAVKPAQCKQIERAAWLLSPLPPENTSELIGFIVAMTQQGKTAQQQAGDKIKLCPVK